MSMQSSNPMQTLIGLINQKQFAKADFFIKPLLKNNPKAPQLWHFQSVISHGLNKPKQCENALKKALALKEDYLPALQNLATFYKQRGNLEQATATFNKLIALTPNDFNVLFNYGVMLNQRQKYQKSEAILYKASNLIDHALATSTTKVSELNLTSLQLNIQIALGQSYLHQEKLELAKQRFLTVLNTQHNNISALNNLALVLKKQCLFDQAITHLNTALSSAPGTVEVMKNLASCYTLVGDLTASKRLYTQILKLNPLDIDAHHWLNQMLWEHNDDDFLGSYHLALKTNQNQPDLQFALAHKLKLADQHEHAFEVLKSTLKTHKQHLPSLLEIADIAREQGMFIDSLDYVQRANKVAGTATLKQQLLAKQELGKSFISIGEYKTSLSLFNKLLSHNDTHQGWWAYKTVALRMLKMAEYDYLCDYQQFILSAKITPPSGYNNLAEFNHELTNSLKAIHYGSTHPLDQTLKNGSQTGEKLFDYQIPIIKELTQSLTQQTLEFLMQLPKDNVHPLLKHNTLHFKETDSWSVILNSSGFHTDHYHPAGWLSSCYYVQVPDMVHNNSQQQGFIKFGQPGFNTQDTIAPERVIEPEQGLLVQFPSYFWHGTKPFESKQTRITTPYDILPV